MSVRPANWREIHDRQRTNPINRLHPTRFPYVGEIMHDPMVQEALDRAWRDTNADVIPVTAACEQGGWIYMNLPTGRLTIIRKENHLGPPPSPGENDDGYLRLDLNNPPLVGGSVVVAIFHTHPTVPFGGASDQDRALAMYYGVPSIVRGQEGRYDIVGPLSEARSGSFHTALSNPGIPVR